LKFNSLIGFDLIDNSQEAKEKNECSLVWEGAVKNRSFGTIIFKLCPTITFAREYLKKLGCEHYWDIAQTDSLLKHSDDF
jgi:U4/U6 small nuclear ribonucleoprotein PRP3